MRILLTGSSGWLGSALAPLLRGLGHEVIGIDPVPSAETRIVGSIADRDLIMRAVGENRIEAIIHGGALHKPNIESHANSDFIAANVQGTLNLLDAAVAANVQRFVFTSTTSLMISQAIRDGFKGGARKAAWLTEAMSPEPRNIYGVTKLSAEHLCRLYHLRHRLPVVVLRTARFFPEPDGACDRAVGRQHQGERTAVSAADGGRCGAGACRGIGEGTGARLRHLHRLCANAVPAR
ncbi:NAD-dependent epimerase/dehydratase family protein [Mesorhizobium sp. Cs1299R1N3]|uniref:NAD-dependent epimerase/dehydratase family protein n=1 Tax=Mesorhizobium sp. Cs1299R1N3 TaxID=3015173 RepID=UPI00301E395B